MSRPSATRARLSPRLIPEAIAEAIFPASSVSPCERGAVADIASRDPGVMEITINTLLLRIHEPTELEVVVGEIAAHPRVRRAFEQALATHRAARATRPNPSPPPLSAADPHLPCKLLGELETVTFRVAPKAHAIPHTFASPRPVLAHNPSGLLILGGAYRVGARGLVG